MGHCTPRRDWARAQFVNLPEDAWFDHQFMRVSFDQLSDLLALYSLTVFSQQADFDILPPHLARELLEALRALWDHWSQATGVPEGWFRGLRARIQFAESAAAL